MRQHFEFVNTLSVDNLSTMFVFSNDFGWSNQAKHRLCHNVMMIIFDFNNICDEPYTNNWCIYYIYTNIINNVYSNFLYIVYGLNKISGS